MNAARTRVVLASLLLSTGSLCFVAVRGQVASTETPLPQQPPASQMLPAAEEAPNTPTPPTPPTHSPPQASKRPPWQIQRPTLVWQQTEKRPVHAVCFSPDGRMLASGRQRGQIQFPSEHAVKLWDVPSGRLLRTFVASNTSLNALSFSPDARFLVGGGSGGLLLWEVATGKLIRRYTGHTDGIKTIAFSPDGKTLASGSTDNTIRLWEVATGKLRHTLTVPDTRKHRSLDHYSVHGVAFSPDGKVLAGAYPYNRTLRLWDAQTGKILRTLPPDGKAFSPGITSVTFSPDGRTVACGRGMIVLSDGSRKKVEYGSVALWEVSSGKRLRVLPSHDFFVTSLAYSPDGSTLLTGGDEGTVRLHDLRMHDLRTGRAQCILYGRGGKGNGDWRQEINSVAFSPDGQYVAGGDTRGFIKVWRIVAS